ncbi:MAG: N-6 DNA methylase [Bryobacterales bacterium]|nr:N-6 DNA methylase [Bryobacterales bacterium]
MSPTQHEGLQFEAHDTRARLQATCQLLATQYGYPNEWYPDRWRVKQTEVGLQIAICTETGGAILVGIIVVRQVPNALTILKHALEEEAICSYGILIQDQQITAYRYRSKNSDLVSINQLEAYKLSKQSPRPLTYTRTENATKCDGLTLEPLSGTVESVFFEAHSHIRDIDGLHADEALDELCKVLYAKLHDEETTLPNHPFKAQYSVYGNTAELSTSFRELYQHANEYDNRVYSLRIPGYKRSRGVFDEPIRLSAPALSRVVEEFQRYDISASALDVKGRAFQKTFLPALRAGMGQYFTPHNVVQLIVESVNPNASHLVLDPFCGSGHFLTQTLEFVRNHSQRKLADDFAYHKLHGIEKSERMVRVAMTDMRLHGDGHANIRCTDALLPFSNYHDVEKESFDLVLTNPPFGSVLSVEAMNSIGRFELAKKGRKTALELLGLERSLQFLRPNGLLAIVLPESIFVNSSTRYVREWLRSKAHIRAIVSLPIETFSPFGANIKTSILFCRKRHRSSAGSPPVFLGIVENIGYDAAGRRLAGTDCEELARKLGETLHSEV